ncbi:hypothetical protein PHYBLDRAFT_166088 [Phycomyces blakesleeanus NRRL 1555(-)]|uniref:Uncharacterized protein n=1 Tax=Phycomyces blakesleeanus (strain ATCC 8743b / DSM 1359 / FGSC 10004 / NBRC 33097 / NRRL 1555) TaxID=763407 RepID=A0A162Q0P9_PHYB8|nr:hypothetical protein PHYBLDRAFT_166088 [Phycomyces blakesleeanus NRRL 1555(-)]OAD76116.1 hypothetical protein PHYBLDRAFT_166088 [Phycomyces blakesleeanus NRRL 1555(-)]|eukprot:XP_018294156.1 hypothetical protein PHYBLDRAFT_166088 [Phycomyces blakesleeanus NRRL 1555(-)]
MRHYTFFSSRAYKASLIIGPISPSTTSRKFRQCNQLPNIERILEELNELSAFGTTAINVVDKYICVFNKKCFFLGSYLPRLLARLSSSWVFFIPRKYITILNANKKSELSLNFSRHIECQKQK